MSGYTYPANAINIMVDLETLSTAHNAAIISIGATVVDFGKSTGRSFEFYEKADIKSFENKFDISKDTIEWWKKQDPAIKQEAFSGTQSIYNLINNFRTWILSVKDELNDGPILLWGNAAEFDCAILVNAFDTLYIGIPWTYRNHRCYRTMNALFQGMVTPPFPGIEKKHHAFYDAKFQAHRLKYIFERIYGEE